MKRMSSSRNVPGGARLGLEELELRWQPASLGLGLSIAAAHGPDVLPAVSALVRGGYVEAANANVGTHTNGKANVAVANGVEQASPTAVKLTATITTQESFFSVRQVVASQPAVTTTIIIIRPVSTRSDNSPMETSHSAVNTTIGTVGSVDRMATASFRSVTSLTSTPVASLAIASAPSTTVLAAAFGPLDSTTRTGRVTTTETTTARPATRGQDLGTNTTSASETLQLGQQPWQWIGEQSDVGSEDSGMSKPAQPPADAKKQPDDVQPPVPVDPATQPGEPSANALDVFPDTAVIIPGESLPEATSVSTVVEEARDPNQNWIATAAAAVMAVAGYPLHRWYKKFRHSRIALLDGTRQV